MAVALAPLRSPIALAVQEREILRVVAGVQGSDGKASMELARSEVLAWAQRRCGGKLPLGAWDGETFELLLGGRTTLGVRILTQGTELWGLRCDDPDKEVARRVWTTEITLGRKDNHAPQLSLRLLANSPEAELRISPHVPGLVQQIAAKCGLCAGAYEVEGSPKRVETDQDMFALFSMLESADRRLPLLLMSGDERTEDSSNPLIDAYALTRATIGLAHVVIIPANRTYALSDEFGKNLSVYHGAVRAYLPGFDSASDPYEHRLWLSDAIKRDVAIATNEMRAFAARESLRRTRMGHDVLPFVAVRSAALGIEQERRINTGASDSEQLETAKKRIDALEAEITEARSEVQQTLDIALVEEERARTAESQLNSARARIQALASQLNARGVNPDATNGPPKIWSGFADWCDQVLVGRLALTPAARRGVRHPEFKDVELVGRCLLWLASTCRDRRINGGGSLANIPIEEGIENAPSGSDDFEFDYQGRNLAADWHVKSGGNTRDPIRCLRIYYAFDDATQQIVVADMPAHRSSGAS
jgi:hypothetical protein